MSVVPRELIVSVVIGLAMLSPIRAQETEPAPPPVVDQAVPMRVIPLAHVMQENSVRLTSRSTDDETTRYAFNIEKHTMYVTIANTGIVTVNVQYQFANPTALADVFPELKMDFDQFPRQTSDGSEIELAVRINSSYEFDNLEEFENKLPKMFLHYDVLKDSEPVASIPQIQFGGVTPRIIIQAEEEIPLIRIEPAQKKNGG